MKRSYITFTACIAFCGAVLFFNSCGNRTQETTSEDTPAFDTTRNSEAREDSIKMAEALALQSKFQHVVYAAVETPPVESQEGEDAADDPAIWYNDLAPEKSVVIGTNKKSGLHVYDLQGRELSFLGCGAINNVDVRGNIVAGSNRSDSTIIVLRFDPESNTLKELEGGRIKSSVAEVYGFCLYQDNNGLYAFVNGKDGAIEQWKLNVDGDMVTPGMVRTLKVYSQPEGMVADDSEELLYVGVEEDAIYLFSASADGDTLAQKINNSSALENPDIVYDIEGLALAKEDDKTYLIASVQGSFSYAVFNVTNPGESTYINSFTIGDKIVDAVEETDGIEVSVLFFNDEFPEGMLVVQDGFNYDGDSLMNQNFKYISWKDIKTSINL